MVHRRSSTRTTLDRRPEDGAMFEMLPLGQWDSEVVHGLEQLDLQLSYFIVDYKLKFTLCLCVCVCVCVYSVLVLLRC